MMLGTSSSKMEKILQRKFPMQMRKIEIIVFLFSFLRVEIFNLSFVVGYFVLFVAVLLHSVAVDFAIILLRMDRQ